MVVDHMGRPDVRQDIGQKPFQLLLDLIRSRGWWTKISNADRFSTHGGDCDDLRPFVGAVIEADPDRAIWGTDWPHPNYAHTTGRTMPNDCDLLELLYSFTPEPEIRRKVLVDNPARLLGFDDA
jgi:2-pyrone-4,6-dicarboxylate lactonase